MQIRGNTQIINGTITADRLVSNLSLPTAQLAEGSLFFKVDGSKTLTASMNFGGFKGTNVADPQNPQDIATKNYVDLLVQGLRPKDAVRVATTANITLSGTQTVDGVALVIGERVLVKNQTTPADNGLYTVASGAWTRTSDGDTGAELKGGSFVFVQEGTSQSDTGWVVSTDGVINLGTTPVNWIQFSSAGTILAGNGLVKAGNAISIQLQANSGLQVDGTGVGILLDGTTLSKSGTGVKLADPGAGKFYLGNGSGAAAAVTLSGDATISSTGVVTVANVLRAANYVFGEVPAGSVNGSNTAFTLAAAATANTESVYINGVRQARGGDYTLSGLSLTFVSAPTTGDTLLVDYLK